MPGRYVERQNGPGCRRAQRYLEHPDETPELAGRLPYLIHPPSRLASDAAWIAFRDLTLYPMLRSRPHDPHLPLFLERVEAVLAWRAGVAQDERFWRA